MSMEVFFFCFFFSNIFKQLYYEKCNVETSPNKLCLLLYLFNFQMTPKSRIYVDQKRQDNFSCKHENTWKNMEFSKGGE